MSGGAADPGEKADRHNPHGYGATDRQPAEATASKYPHHEPGQRDDRHYRNPPTRCEDHLAKLLEGAMLLWLVKWLRTDF